MKKTLFSLAFVAASGAYVAAASHFFGPGDDGTQAAAMLQPPAAAASDPSQDAIAPILPSAPTDMALASSSLEFVPPLAKTAIPATANPAPTPVVVAQAPAPAMPPVPRPRPATPVDVVPATSNDVAGTTSGYRDGTYTGSSEDAYYGRVQVQVTIASQKIASVKVLIYPQDRRTSRYINSQALPLLKQEVIAANSASVDTVSGATLTSEAYIRSLSNALAQAGGANA